MPLNNNNTGEGLPPPDLLKKDVNVIRVPVGAGDNAELSHDLPAMTIRALQLDDFEQWLEAWLAYQEFYQVTLDDEVSRTTFKRFFDEREPIFAAVAVQEGQVIGLAHAVVHRSTWSSADFCYLEDLYVSPSVRGGGVGKALIEWVQALAREKQCSRFYWHTQQSNKRAQKLYDWVAKDAGTLEYRMEL